MHLMLWTFHLGGLAGLAGGIVQIVRDAWPSIRCHCVLKTQWHHSTVASVLACSYFLETTTVLL